MLVPARAPAMAAGLAPVGLTGSPTRCAPRSPGAATAPPIPARRRRRPGRRRPGGAGSAGAGRSLPPSARRWVMRPRRELLVAERGRVAQRPEVGKEACLVVAVIGRRHSPGSQLGTFPSDTYGFGHHPAPALHHLG